METLIKRIPVWLVAICVVAFLLIFVERTYISKQPFKLFGQDWGPVMPAVDNYGRQIASLSQDLANQEKTLAELRSMSSLQRQKGERGEKGEKGEKGLQGNPGKDADVLHVSTTWAECEWKILEGRTATYAWEDTNYGKNDPTWGCTDGSFVTHIDNDYKDIAVVGGDWHVRKVRCCKPVFQKQK